MNDKIQLDSNYDIFTEEALDQLEVAGIASVSGNQVHYYDVERNIYRYCASTNNVHIAVCRVLASVDEEFLDGIVDTDSFCFSDVREVA
tara:strand:- start:892 stop:1158 length:267 start_codon:yes stop_codon:yes gene_type:complete